MTDVTTELAKLTASTTELTNTVVGKYAALDSKVAAASDSASGAAASVTAAGAHVTSAQQAKAAAEAARVGAETAEANAAAVVTGGTATTLSEAGKIPLANSEGKIDNAWIAGAAKCTKHDFEARRAANNEKFAASGFVHFGVGHNSGNVNEGLWVSISENVLNLGKSGIASGHVGNSKTTFPQINVAGVLSKIESIGYSSSGLNRVKLPPAEDGTRTYDSATGVSVTHATPAIAFASETDTNKVVTDRVDMWGFEAFLREINDADPFVYANGIIQSLAPSINGVTTVEDNVRPITYFAWYEGDESSRGNGVNWQTASEANRIKIASDPANNIYFDDATGKFYQWCIRGRSFAGPGNGDWENLSSRGINIPIAASVLTAKGIQNDRAPFVLSNFGAHSYRGSSTTYNNRPSEGAFTVVSSSNNTAINGECHFLVCGTVNRLNRGAYHPSFNPSGTNSWNKVDGWGEKWSDGGVNKPLSRVAAFHKSATFEDVGTPRNTDLGGSIVSDTVLGRPDGRFYDAIYASGAGGVCRDMRYSAWGLTQEDFAEADLKVKSGEYRGRERLVKTTFYPNVFKGYIGASNNSHSSYKTATGMAGSGLDFFGNGLTPNKPVVVIQPASGVHLYGKVSSSNGHLSLTAAPSNRNSSAGNSIADQETLLPNEPVYIASVEDVPISVSDEYTHTEVIGDPANILQCDDLKDGWIGSWNPVIPDGATAWDTFQATRAVVDTVLNKVQTDNNGDAWVSGYHGFSPINNAPSATSSPLTSRVEVWSYKTKAKVTEGSVNSKVYGGNIGVGTVITCTNHSADEGSLLSFSLSGQINTDSTYNNLKNSALRMKNLTLSTTGSIRGEASSPWSENTHQAITLSAPLNNSPALKALNYNAVENQQGFINYAYTELQYNGTDWGDDGKIHITNKQSTMLDTNGQRVLVGTARIVEPLGWIKNDK